MELLAFQQFLGDHLLRGHARGAGPGRDLLDDTLDIPRLKVRDDEVRSEKLAEAHRRGGAVAVTAGTKVGEQ
jgi:hypothetical protein